MIRSVELGGEHIMPVPGRPDNVLIGMTPGQPITARRLEQLVPSPDGHHTTWREIEKLLGELQGRGLVSRDGDAWKLTQAGVTRRSEVMPGFQVRAQNKTR